MLEVAKILIKRVVLAVGMLAGIATTVLAVDKFVLHPQRQAIKILRYYASADARRIHELEQLVATPHLAALSLAPQAAAEACVKSTVASVHADYNAIPSQFERCKAALATYASAWIPAPRDELLFSIYVTALASQLGDYGPSSETDVRVIAKGGMLNCTQTMIFVAETLKAFRPAIPVTQIALEGASIGQHGLVETAVAGQKLVMDGATGTIFLASMNKMMKAGRKHVAMIDFFDETDRRLSDLFDELARSIQLGRLSSDTVATKRVL